ncbi:phage regulatory CII family protein [Xenophilus sp. Marseille-Q4582]|uniref:phage regulatory CII family protein n=1 Tax=Xenophilus sp. Marseille-Q4582 TaxID=2866600 RepID=UPI001CE47A37|nr:phage regulatory CII family protein [Xenophilus sp. Marseille-Q4582]
MNLRDSARSLARRMHGGIEAWALRVGKNPASARHELAGSSGYKLGLEDAELMTQFAIEQNVSDPLQILNTFARNVGAMVVPLPGMYETGGCTMQDLSSAAREFAEFVAAAASATADGKVSANELAQVDQELAHLIGCAQRVRATLAAMHEAGKPTSERSVVELPVRDTMARPTAAA